MNFCTHPMLAVNVGGTSISLHFSSWRNLALLLIIFLDTQKPLERRSCTHSNKTSSISRSKGFLPAPSSRFRLQLADSNLLWLDCHSRILFRSTLNFFAALWLLLRSTANCTASGLNSVEWELIFLPAWDWEASASMFLRKVITVRSWIRVRMGLGLQVNVTARSC